MSQKHQSNWVLANTTRRATALFLGALALGGARTASAQHRFGDKGQLAITGENLFGISTETVKTDLPPGKVSATSNHLGLLLSAQSDDATLSTPRVGGHYFIIPNLSIGGTIGFDSRGGETTHPVGNGGFRTDPVRDRSTLLFLPKVGYTLMFSDVFGFWFRGGVGYVHRTDTSPTNSNDTNKYSFWFLALDAPFVISPVPHFAFYVGPAMEFSFAGTYSAADAVPGGGVVTTSVGASYFHLNLAAGLIGYFDL
jgi:hypothetical protein